MNDYYAVDGRYLSFKKRIKRFEQKFSLKATKSFSENLVARREDGNVQYLLFGCGTPVSLPENFLTRKPKSHRATICEQLSVV